MSSLWTPDGERRVPPAPPAAPPGAGDQAPPPGGRRRAPAPQSEGERLEELAEVQRQLLGAPPEVVVANHAFGLFELAALHLSQPKPDFPAARLAIDGMGALVEGLAGRLGEVERDLTEGLAQIRLAFVQVQAGTAGRGDGGGPEPGAGGPLP